MSHTRGPVEWKLTYTNRNNKRSGGYLQNGKGDLVIVTELESDPPYGADRDLIADAFNVAHETGLTPRELAADRDRLHVLLSCAHGALCDTGLPVPGMDQDIAPVIRQLTEDRDRYKRLAGEMANGSIEKLVAEQPAQLNGFVLDQRNNYKKLATDLAFALEVLLKRHITMEIPDDARKQAIEILYVARQEGVIE